MRNGLCGAHVGARCTSFTVLLHSAVDRAVDRQGKTRGHAAEPDPRSKLESYQQTVSTQFSESRIDGDRDFQHAFVAIDIGGIAYSADVLRELRGHDPHLGVVESRHDVLEITRARLIHRVIHFNPNADSVFLTNLTGTMRRECAITFRTVLVLVHPSRVELTNTDQIGSKEPRRSLDLVG
jgi:hypothetical protein